MRSSLSAGLVGSAVLLMSACGSNEMPQSKPTPIPEMESAGGQLMKEHCANCHAPPQPNTHTADEWPNVIYRMSEKLRLKGYPPMSQEEIQTLVTYLQKHAKG